MSTTGEFSPPGGSFIKYEKTNNRASFQLHMSEKAIRDDFLGNQFYAKESGEKLPMSFEERRLRDQLAVFFDNQEAESKASRSIMSKEEELQQQAEASRAEYVGNWEMKQRYQKK